MQLLGKLEINSKQKIIEFLDKESTGRIATIDKNGYPQIIPMNFVFTNNVIYMHSHVKGEKLQNITNNHKVGFEVDRNLGPSYLDIDENIGPLLNNICPRAKYIRLKNQPQFKPTIQPISGAESRVFYETIESSKWQAEFQEIQKLGKK